MEARPAPPPIESHLPQLMAFASELTREHETGGLTSWDAVSKRGRAFFTSRVLADIDTVAPGWKAMAACAEGLTAIHVICVFVASATCPEYRSLSAAEQELMKWVILLHDIAKQVHGAEKDHMHAFRSAAEAGALLPRLGFPVTAEYDAGFRAWHALTCAAMVRPQETGPIVPDNAKLPDIMAGIDDLFGRTTSSALIVKTILLHCSITVIRDWPSPAPLNETQATQLLDPDVFALLHAMLHLDNDAWAFFDPATKARHRRETLGVLGRLGPLIAGAERGGGNVGRMPAQKN